MEKLLAAYQQYQAQAEVVMQQLNITQLTATGLDRALSAVDALDKVEEGQEILVPIGSGSFIHGKLASKERIILNVGAGVNIEKTTEQAREAMKVRKEEVLEGSKRLNEVLAKIESEMHKIQAVLQQFEEVQGQKVQGLGSKGVV